MLVTNLLGRHLLNNEALIAHSRSLLPLSRPQLSRFDANLVVVLLQGRQVPASYDIAQANDGPDEQELRDQSPVKKRLACQPRSQSEEDFTRDLRDFTHMWKQTYEPPKWHRCTRVGHVHDHQHEQFTGRSQQVVNFRRQNGVAIQDMTHILSLCTAHRDQDDLREVSTRLLSGNWTLNQSHAIKAIVGHQAQLPLSDDGAGSNTF